jgi:HSP20 family protein
MADIATVPASKQGEPAGVENTRGIHFVPRVDIYETEQELWLVVDVPGVRAEDVNLHYEKGELTLHARVQPRPGRSNWLLKEYDEGDFFRSFRIHETIDSTKIEAQCKNGVLTVRLPKAEAARPRLIQVKAE